jgi:predicted RND superfamily exporter protein
MKELITQFYPYAKKQLGFDRDVKVVLRGDIANAKNPLGMTGHYDPSHDLVVLYTTNRHPKDVLRSFAHELTHHAQNCRGDLKNNVTGEPGYAQKDPHLRNMELEAYRASILVRDWEDAIKGGTITMSQQITITERELRNLVRETLASLSQKTTQELEEVEEIQEEVEEIEEAEEVATSETENLEESQQSDKEWFNEQLQQLLVDKFVKK